MCTRKLLTERNNFWQIKIMFEHLSLYSVFTLRYCIVLVCLPRVGKPETPRCHSLDTKKSAVKSWRYALCSVFKISLLSPKKLSNCIEQNVKSYCLDYERPIAFDVHIKLVNKFVNLEFQWLCWIKSKLATCTLICQCPNNKGLKDTATKWEGSTGWKIACNACCSSTALVE